MALKYKPYDPFDEVSEAEGCAYDLKVFTEGNKVFYYSWYPTELFCSRTCAKNWLGDVRAGIISTEKADDREDT
jgi:hypothetical protein